MSKLFDNKPIRVTINNNDIHHKIKVGNLFMNQYVIVAMVLKASDEMAKTYELKLRKL